jgi:lipopolysaccharide export system protein LptA
MKAAVTCSLALLFAALGAFAAAEEPAQDTQSMKFRGFEVLGKGLRVSVFEGILEWPADVTVTIEGADMVLTCDRLKMWVAEAGGGAKRVEATGNIHIQGKHVAADKAVWLFEGSAASATYDKADDTVTLEGSVKFKAVNESTGAWAKADADKAVYDMAKRDIDMERSDGRVHVEYYEPDSETEPAAPPAEPSAQEDEKS